jgi:hypothetical protein
MQNYYYEVCYFLYRHYPMLIKKPAEMNDVCKLPYTTGGYTRQAIAYVPLKNSVLYML